MNVYPDLPIAVEGSTHDTLDSVLTDRSVGGELRARSFWDDPKAQFRCRHALLDVAERRAVEDFYRDNRAVVFEFDWSNVSYFCYFTKAPTYKPLGGDTWEVTFEVQEA